MPINLSVFCDALKLSSIKKEMVKLLYEYYNYWFL